MSKIFADNIPPEEQEFVLADRKKLSKIYILRNYPKLNSSEKTKMSQSLFNAGIIPVALNANQFYSFDRYMKDSGVVTETSWILNAFHLRDQIYRELHLLPEFPTSMKDIQVVYAWYQIFKEVQTPTNQILKNDCFVQALILKYFLPDHLQWSYAEWQIFIRDLVTTLRPDRRKYKKFIDVETIMEARVAELLADTKVCWMHTQHCILQSMDLEEE